MKKPPKIHSPARQAARVALWTIFGMVLLARFVSFKDDRPPPFRQPFGQQQQRQFRFPRPITRTQPPVAEVPKDLPRIQIEISQKQTDVLRGYMWNGWRGRATQERPEVLATVREEGTTYTNVALHLKGAAGSFREFDDKPALTLNFAKHAPGQRFHGYSKISLNNSVQDATFLCEKISRELFDAAGVPVPKADFATVLINERDLGVYVTLEGYNKDFLRRYFKNVKGNLYDGGFCQEVSPNLAVNSGDHPEDHSDIRRLLSAAYEPVPATRWARLNEVLDVDRFINMVAMEVLLCHWDGYSLNRNNYRLFHDLETDRFIFMPHGLDQMFDYPPGRFPPEGSIQPNMKGLLSKAVLGTPEGSRLYRERLEALEAKFFRDDTIVARVRELAEHIRPTLAAYDPTLAQWHDSAVASLCDRITRRARSVAAQLNRPREPLQFDASGSVSLPNWDQKLVTQGGALKLDKTEEDGKTLLHLAAVNRGGTGSWRTRVLLPEGHYRFEGRAKVSPDALGGRVTLRISGDSRLSGTSTAGTDWTPLRCSFPLEAFQSEVVLVCEFSGARGEAWFDIDSLRLVRE